MTTTATVRVTVEDGRKAWFRCPNCDRKVSLRNAFPFGWHYKRCGGCQWVWTNLDVLDAGIGPHAEDLPAGYAQSVSVVSTGRPVR
jgi:hypothetical protein